ncbi:uncharacterized protein [Littorina saxatilis]|uniref:uncharacterized protein n=1 Tax=Littorina saxatilis TaxID=31220 RepID=UPI0038B66850
MHVRATLVLLCVLVTRTLQEDGDKVFMPEAVFGDNCTTEGKHCIKTANCVDSQCVCPENYKGNGLIACVKKNEFLCEASLDPFIVAFGGMKSILTLPCRYRLTNFFVPYDNGNFQFCSIEVFAQTSVTVYGAYYQKGVDVNIAIGNFNKQDEIVSLDVKKLKVVDDDIVRFIMFGDHSQDSPWGKGMTENWNGLDLFHYYDPIDNFAVLDGCGAAIKFRPYNFSMDDPVQKFKPGIAIQAPANATFPSTMGGLPSLCASPYDNPEIFDELKKARKLLNTDAAFIYNVLLLGINQTASTRGDYHVGCTNSISTFQTCMDREAAVNFCCRILYNVRIMKCLMEKEINMMDTFLKCLEYKCKNACDAFVTILAPCSRKYKPFRDIECGKH